MSGLRATGQLAIVAVLIVAGVISGIAFLPLLLIALLSMVLGAPLYGLLLFAAACAAARVATMAYEHSGDPRPRHLLEALGWTVFVFVVLWVRVFSDLIGSLA